MKLYDFKSVDSVQDQLKFVICHLNQIKSTNHIISFGKINFKIHKKVILTNKKQ